MRFTPRLALVAIALSAAAMFTAFRSGDSDPQTVTIIENTEPGRRLEFSGRLLDYAGRPLSRAAVLAYNADAQGLYNPAQQRDADAENPRRRRHRRTRPIPLPNRLAGRVS